MSRLFIFCVFICLILIFPVIGNGSGEPSNYIEGDIHSNQNVKGTDYSGGGGKNFYIEGDVSVVNNVSLPVEDVSGTITSPAPSIYIPDIDFEVFKNADGQTIAAPSAWDPGATNQIMYIDGDVKIHIEKGSEYAQWRRKGSDTWESISDYQNKTIIATGDISVYLKHDGGSGYIAELYANLIAKGSIDIDIHGCGCGEERAVTGFIYAKGESSLIKNKDWNHDYENTEDRPFTGVNIDLHGGGHVDRNIIGVVMAKNGSIRVDIYGGGNGDKGISKDSSVITDNLLDFFNFLTYWREIRG